MLLPKKHRNVHPPFFWGPPFFKGWIAVCPPFFLRMEGAQGGPKKGDASPFFIFFMDCVFRVRQERVWKFCGNHRPVEGPFSAMVGCLRTAHWRWWGVSPSQWAVFRPYWAVSPNALMGRFPSWNSPGKQPIKKRGIKRFCGKFADISGRFSHNFLQWLQRFPRVTSIGPLPPKTLGKSREPPQNPAKTPQNPRRDPAEPSERPPQSPPGLLLRGVAGVTGLKRPNAWQQRRTTHPFCQPFSLDNTLFHCMLKLFPPRSWDAGPVEWGNLLDRLRASEIRLSCSDAICKLGIAIGARLWLQPLGYKNLSQRIQEMQKWTLGSFQKRVGRGVAS